METIANATVPPFGADQGHRGLSNEAIITIVVFLCLAFCIFAGAVYLLIKGKNISDILEESLEDEACGCIGIMNESTRTEEGLPDEVRSLLLSFFSTHFSARIFSNVIKELKFQIFIAN
jgi:hypothetical protein